MKDRLELPDLIIFIVTLALLGTGIVMVFSASSVTAYHEMGDPYYYLKRQSMWAAIGLVALVLAMNIDYHVWYKLAWPLLIASIAALGLVLVPGVGKLVGGSRRWLGVGPLKVQPSEFAKVALVIFLASYLSDSGDRVRNFWTGIVVPMMIAGLFAVLVLKEPDMGTAIAMCGVSWFMLLVAGGNVFALMGLVAVAFPAGIKIAAMEEYRWRRLTSFINPWADPLDSGFHIIQSLLALGSGGIVGVGLGLSRQKFYYLPEQHTDFIFAIIGEELGFIGTAMVVCLYILFGWRGFRTAMNVQDTFGSLLASGITLMVTLQAVMNIGVVTGVLPITGITLPLISSGGSSLVPMLGSIGILLNISRHVSQR